MQARSISKLMVAASRVAPLGLGVEFRSTLHQISGAPRFELDVPNLGSVP